MQPPGARSAPTVPGVTTQLVRLGILLLPSWLLLWGSLRSPTGQLNTLLWLGAVFQILFCFLSFQNQQGWGTPAGSSIVSFVMGLYLIALGWLWLGTTHPRWAGTTADWFYHLALAVLLVVPVVVYAFQALVNSSTSHLRRAYALAQAIAERKDWPHDLGDCRTLPEVKALRDALQTDAAPALALLADARPQVRLAALAALEFRKHWGKGQAERVLTFARQAKEPLVRAAAVTALGNLDERPLVEGLAEFLRDPSREVRRAALEALLWDTGRRWPWIRNAVRSALTDPALHDDGPLAHDSLVLPPEVLRELAAWTAERGQLASRTALTLGVYYARALNDHSDQTLLGELRAQLTDPRTPSPLRLELARLLLPRKVLGPEQLEKLLDPANPAPLRLQAVDALLADSPHAGAVLALRDIARVSNREIALSTASVLQRRLGIPLGLNPDEPPPSVLSRQAAEVMRHVMAWSLADGADGNSPVTVANRMSSSEF